MTGFPDQLLAEDDPAPVTVFNEGGRSSFLIVADHAGNAIPRAVQLGISAADLERHIAWDIGIAVVSRLLASALDATLISQNFSRLVIDCNRPLDAPDSIPGMSETTTIPGNMGLNGRARAARQQAIFRPYHDAIATAIDRRPPERPPVLVAMHSFTPVFRGVPRPWHVGLLYNRDPRLGRALGLLLRQQGDVMVGDNQPYTVSDTTDFTVPVHGENRGLVHVAIEIRQDLIATHDGQSQWASRLAALLPEALREI